MKKSFLSHDKPLIVGMVQAETAKDAICLISDSLYDGAEAFGIQLCSLKKEFRSEDCIKEIFSYCKDLPIYITSYRTAYSHDLTDDETAELLLKGFGCGATLCDVMGDLFCPSDREITFDRYAAAKQKQLIDEIHSHGGEVIMSSHQKQFIDENEVIRIAFTQQERGADIAKIVNKADTEEQMYKNLAVFKILNDQLRIKYLYLAGGKYSAVIRYMGTALGSCMTLGVQKRTPANLSSKEQPLLRNIKAVRDNMAL